jgi:uncharacterized membrane protein
MEWLSGGTLKFLHVVGAAVIFGTGLGTAFQMWRADRSRDARFIAGVARGVITADWLFTAPAVVLQPVTGYFLARAIGWPLDSGWIVLSAALYVFAGVCWCPVVWLQIRMRRLADDAVRTGAPLPDRYRRCARVWFWLGWPAFGAVLVIFHLMIARPEIAW